MSRILVCVLDGVGAGAAPDADAYGDAGSDTLRHVLERSDVALPNLAALGLGEVVGLPLGAPRSGATYGRLLERGAGKDTTTGHWEMMGVVLERPFPTYPHGFPAEVDRAVRAGHRSRRALQRAGLGHRGDRAARRRARPHRPTDRLHLGRLGVPGRLSRGCRAGGDSLRVVSRGARDPQRPARRRARHRAPVRRRVGSYERTPRRRDFSLEPVGTTYLDLLHDAGVAVVGVGKIGEIFAQRGVDVDDHTTDNAAGLAACRRHLREMRHGLLFANLVDFDQIWGHRNDVPGFAAALKEVDDAVPGLLAELEPGDVALWCADHGVDPTTESTDHSREYAPLLAWGLRGGRWDGLFEDVGATAYARLTGRTPPLPGTAIP